MSGDEVPEERDLPGEGEPLEFPVDGVLDLHTFRPSEVKEVVSAYIEACLEADILELRIIHGKGIGTLREQVHAQLRKTRVVQHFSLAPEHAGGWGATLVRLQHR